MSMVYMQWFFLRSNFFSVYVEKLYYRIVLLSTIDRFMLLLYVAN